MAEGDPGERAEAPGPEDGRAGRPAEPDPVLMAAAAMVFVDTPASPILTQGDAHHLLDVLRLRTGELVVACDGAGSWAPCRVSAASGTHRAQAVDPARVLEVEGGVTTQPRPRPPITVAFAPTKGDRPEWVTQKLTELGVDRIVPIHANRSVVRWEGERGARSVERLRRVAREAAAQCRRTWLPEVSGVTPLPGLASLSGGPPRLAQPGGGPPSLAHPVVAVGPEGGWDEGELARFGTGVGLGATVLRAETAAVVVGSILCGLRSGVIGSLA
ncbi:MAG TPA: RsmE family RNA methyltransferase [Acidimicrobiales bacterium]|nr:RsmE family RNA methyltransferase [Acidimicrobiales bacterium]